MSVFLTFVILVVVGAAVSRIFFPRGRGRSVVTWALPACLAGAMAFLDLLPQGTVEPIREHRARPQELKTSTQAHLGTSSEDSQQGFSKQPKFRNAANTGSNRSGERAESNSREIVSASDHGEQNFEKISTRETAGRPTSDGRFTDTSPYAGDSEPAAEQSYADDDSLPSDSTSRGQGSEKPDYSAPGSANLYNLSEALVNRTEWLGDAPIGILDAIDDLRGLMGSDPESSSDSPANRIAIDLVLEEAIDMFDGLGQDPASKKMANAREALANNEIDDALRLFEWVVTQQRDRTIR
jgi:hypothetical protein